MSSLVSPDSYSDSNCELIKFEEGASIEEQIIRARLLELTRHPHIQPVERIEFKGLDISIQKRALVGGSLQDFIAK